MAGPTATRDSRHGSPLILSLSKGERGQRRLSAHPEPVEGPDLILVCRVMGVEPAELLGRLD